METPERVSMTPPFAGFLLLSCFGGCGTTRGWDHASVGGLQGGFSSTRVDSSSELVDPLSYSSSSLSTLSIATSI
jgi:hypothetical protein